MSHACFAEAFAPAEARYRAEVMKDTWGHLAPKLNAVYRGHITFAFGCFGSDYLNATVLDCQLESKTAGELTSSPWFYDTMIDFLDTFNGEEGAIFRFEGYFKNYEFVGSVCRMTLTKGAA